MAAVTIIEAVGMPVGWQAPNSLHDEAERKEKDLVKLGKEINERRDAQVEILKWFAEKPERVWARGYKDLYDWVQDADVAEALWGREVKSRATSNRLVRFVNLQLAVPELEVMGTLPPSTVSTGAFSQLERKAKALPAKDAPNRAEAVAEFQQDLTAVSEMKYREKLDAARKERAQVLFYDPEAGVVWYRENKDAAPVDVVQILPQSGEIGAEVLHRILHPECNFAVNENEVRAFMGGKTLLVGNVLTQDTTLLNMISDALNTTRSTS